jgi:2'-5' RNA ligase
MQRDRASNESVGCFITLPSELAKQYPSNGKQGEDTSPPHVTTFYIGDILPQFEEPMLEVMKQVCENFKQFKIKIKKPKTFENDKGQIIYHSPIVSPKLVVLNATLQKAFQLRQLPYSRKWPEFKPHCTIAYCDNKEQLKEYEHIQPEGEFMAENIWVWRPK